LMPPMLPLVAHLILVVPLALGQAPGKQKENVNLPLAMEECTGSEDCTPIETLVTLDSNWRWVHKPDDFTNCYTGNLWDQELCPDAATCTNNCVLEGVDEADWTGTYGVTTENGAMTLKFVTHGPYSTNIGSRTYLLAPDGANYQMFYLKNKEFTFDVDVSQLPCGLNGALYFVEMDEDGGTGKYPTNTAGAAYGVGYCDAQCPHDLKWINGEANCEDWKPSDNDANAGTGHYGSCCNEMDIWEANSVATAYTPHVCDTVGQERCEGTDCGDNASDERYDGVCDKDGCDFNSWRLGDKTFFGPGADFAVDGEKPMTVVTQFITHDGTDTGDLVEIRRIYVQDGKIIQNSFSDVSGVDPVDSVDDKFCSQVKKAFNDMDDFSEKGSLKTMGESLARGHVLVMSMWDDHDAHMLWLDSNFPLDKDPSEPGVNRGPCPTDSGDPVDMETNHPDASVVYSKIRVGTLGSTYPGGDSPTDRPTDRPTDKPTDRPTDRPTTNHCPGGSLAECISMCPKHPAEMFEACVLGCMTLCQ